MANLQTPLIILLIGIVVGLTIHLHAARERETILQEQILEKDKEIHKFTSKPVGERAFMKISDAENLIIEKIKETETYKRDLSHVELYSYLKFRNSGFQSDYDWVYGSMQYNNVYKIDDTNEYKEGQPIAPLGNDFDYIVKFDYKGDIERLSIYGISSAKEWNDNLDRLPESIMSKAKKQDFKMSEN